MPSRGLPSSKSFGLPLLLGASRKRFIDKVSPAPPDRRLGGSIAAHLLAVADGAAIIRTHDVAETVQALRVAAAIRERTMTDAVFVTGLTLHANHGVMQHEAKVGQSFMLDLVLDIDLTAASRSDKLAHTVGYDQVVEVASRAFCARRHRLVEAAAGAVAEAVLGRFAAGCARAGHGAQAARADRSHLCRRRSHHRARPPSKR